jgi:4-hydroxybenzoate polyprenyltransferase
MFLLSFPYSVFLFGINDINDYESDKINPRKKTFPITNDIKRFILTVSVLTAVSLILISALTLNYENVLLTALLLLISYYYSSGPLRFKEIPFFDSFSNGLLFFLVFSAGYSYGGFVVDIPPKIYFVALCVMGIHGFGTVLDCEVDKKMGHNTFAVFFGKRFTLLFIMLTFLSAFYFADIRRNFINYYFIYCSILAFITFVKPVQRVALSCFKLIFAGFVFTSLIFLITY